MKVRLKLDIYSKFLIKYNINEIYNFIKNIKLENIIFSNHSLHKLDEREFIENNIKITISNNIIFGIIYQENNKYLLIINYTNIYDLNIIITLKNEIHLKIITVYKINKQRRIRK